MPANHLRNLGVPMLRESVHIAARGEAWEGALVIPAAARGLVLFTADVTSGRALHHHHLTDAFNLSRFATLSFDRLTPDVERRVSFLGGLRNDCGALARRLAHAVDWATEHDLTRSLPVGLFGIGSGASASLQASVARPAVRAVVCYAGRPDLVPATLDQVGASVLFMIDGYDDQAWETNRCAFARLTRARQRKFIVLFDSTPLAGESREAGDFAWAAVEWFEECFASTGLATT